MDDIVAKPMNPKTLNKLLQENDRRKFNQQAISVSNNQLSTSNLSVNADVKNPLFSPLRFTPQNNTPQTLTRDKKPLTYQVSET
jgi:DNA-binding response OmpR family regulator